MRSDSNLVIHIVGDQETYQVQEVEKETFALIRLTGYLFTESKIRWHASFLWPEKYVKALLLNWIAGIMIAHGNTYMGIYSDIFKENKIN